MIDIVRLAARGDGVTADGRFVAGAVPGDRIDAGGVLVPGPNRAEPACTHFATCGGCQLQHVNEALLAEFAAMRCLEPLRRIGIAPKEVRPVHVSPAFTRRRASLRAARRGGKLELGFNAEGSHALVDLAMCPVLRPELFGLLGPLRHLLDRLLPQKGAVGVSMTSTDTGIDLLIANLAADRLPVVEALSDFAREQRLARLSVEGPLGVETVVAPLAPAIRLGGVAVTLPPGAFLQATADGEAALVEAVREGLAGARRVADLFCGVGTFALPLSQAAHVLAVDASGPAVSALARAAKGAGRPVETLHRDLFRRPLGTAELRGLDAVVIDPPRSGAAAQTAEIAAARIPVVMAISCNPATFARDAGRMVAAGYRLETLWPVAQFRWSTHVELAARFHWS